MPTIIHLDQYCSVPGRSSEDNATLLRDVCDYLEVMKEWPVPLYRLIKKKRLIMLTGAF
jgi:hypothetical protein